MLRTYGPGCDGSTIDVARQHIPDHASWIDLESPTREEEALVERCIGVEVPTQADITEIEPSSRLYERGGALYMTISTLTGITEGEPTTIPLAFVLTDDRLVTLRYQTPKPVRDFISHISREPALVSDSATALLRLLDTIIDRLADEIEVLGDDIEQISSQIFSRSIDARRIPAARLTALLTRIGRAQTLLAKIRYTAVSTSRMLTFLATSDRMQGAKQSAGRNRLSSLSTDAHALTEHASFLSANLTFLLDASLGLIGVEQNAAMKLFSWAAVVFLPPTLIAGIYGMNFRFFPELGWHFGYYGALSLMLASAVLPYLYFRWRRWI
ncbi:MAG: magnesium transporter CorA family protein [Sphingomicrobium sp.]